MAECVCNRDDFAQAQVIFWHCMLQLWICVAHLCTKYVPSSILIYYSKYIFIYKVDFFKKKRYTRWHSFIFKVCSKKDIRYIFFIMALQLHVLENCRLFFFWQPITQTALPRCIAIDILWNRWKVDNFLPVASWLFLLIILMPWGP